MVVLDAVEVRPDPGVQLWCDAYLEDVTENGIVCSFEDCAWLEETFPVEDVRFRGPPRNPVEVESFEPAVSDIVELEVPRTTSAPSGWRRVKVKSRQRGLFFVAPTEKTDMGLQAPPVRGEVIVPRSRLRPLSPSHKGIGDLLQRAEIPIDHQLADWLRTAEAAASFGRVEHMAVGMYERQSHEPGADPSRSGFAQEQLLRVKRATEGDPRVFLIGTEAAVRRAKVLTPAVVQHQMQVKMWENAMKLREKALEDRKKRIAGEMVTEPSGRIRYEKQFEADAVHVARLIGRGGANIQVLQQLYKVRFQILDGPSDQLKIVKVFGLEEKNVLDALDNTELVEDTMDVDPPENGWVIGRNFATINDMRDVSGLQACRLCRETQQLLFTGTRNACNQAKELYRAHVLYFDTFRGMDERIEELVMQLQERGEIKDPSMWNGEDAEGGPPGGLKGSFKGIGKLKGKLMEKGKEKGKLWAEKGKGKFKGKGKGGKGSRPRSEERPR